MVIVVAGQTETEPCSLAIAWRGSPAISFVERRGLISNDKRHQSLSSSGSVANRYDRVAHTLGVSQHRLDLSQFDAEPADLHLVVLATEKLNLPIGQIPNLVPRPVQPGVRRFAERVWHEPVGRQLWPVQIAAGNLFASYAQLARHTKRHRLQALIQNVDCTLANGRPIGAVIACRESAGLSLHADTPTVVSVGP